MQFHYKYSGRAFYGAPWETWPMHDCSTCSRWAGLRGPSGRPGARGPAAPAFRRSPFREHNRRSERREWHISALQPQGPVLGRAQGVIFLRQGKQDSSRRGQLMCQRKPTTTTPSLALLFLFLAFPTVRDTQCHITGAARKSTHSSGNSAC